MKNDKPFSSILSLFNMISGKKYDFFLYRVTFFTKIKNVPLKWGLIFKKSLEAFGKKSLEAWNVDWMLNLKK